MFKDVTIWIVAPVAISVLGLLWTYFGAILNVKERLVTLETKMELFWKPLQAFLTEAIHHPTTPSIDAKLERFDDLSMSELYELKAEIKEDAAKLEEKTGVKALYYTLLLSRIDLRIHDKEVYLCKSKNGVVRAMNALLGRR